MDEMPVIFETTVNENLIDYNGHMTEYAYARVFSDALTKLLEDIGIGSTYKRRTNCTIYSLESHTAFLREAKLGALLTVTCRVLGFDTKRMHLLLNMYDCGVLMASYENISLHVRQSNDGSPRAASFESGVGEWLAAQQAMCDETPWPDFAGRSMSLRKRS